VKLLSEPRKTASNLCGSVQHRLNISTLSAVVTLFGVLALTQPSEARIVYRRTHIQVDNPYHLDLDHDGVTDFTIQQTHVHGDGCAGQRSARDTLSETPAQGNGVVMASNYAAALGRGVEIGSQSFDSAEQIMADVYKRFFERGGMCVHVQQMQGPWVNVSSRYLGLEFEINGKIHYGWARLSVQAGYVYINATLTGYAYETVPGKSIKTGQTKGTADEWDEEDFDTAASPATPVRYTPQPAWLGVLALDAQGVPLWWRRESVVATWKECVVQGS